MEEKHILKIADELNITAKQVAAVAGLLGNHHTGSDIGTVDGCLGCTRPGIGFILAEQGCWVVFPRGWITGSKGTQHLSSHPSIAPESCLVLYCLPDELSGLH